MSTSENYRTSVDDVRMELEADGYSVSSLSNQQVETVGLQPASTKVDEELTGKGMSSDRLALIERYLAGHYILASGVREFHQGEKSGDYNRSDLGSTALGQKAIEWDESNTLGRDSVEFRSM